MLLLEEFLRHIDFAIHREFTFISRLGLDVVLLDYSRLSGPGVEHCDA